MKCKTQAEKKLCISGSCKTFLCPDLFGRDSFGTTYAHCSLPQYSSDIKACILASFSTSELFFQSRNKQSLPQICCSCRRALSMRHVQFWETCFGGSELNPFCGLARRAPLCRHPMGAHLLLERLLCAVMLPCATSQI